MTKIVGILNVTDDSFSEVEHTSSPKSALLKFENLLQSGADYVDIGAESTSYGATPLTHEQEWSRLEPVLKVISQKNKVSIDTYHPETAAKAIDMGYSFINDVTGGKSDKMLQTISKNEHVDYVMMHNIKVPADRDFRIKDISEIYDWGKINIKRALDFGIKKEKIIFDPGLGFTTNPKEAFEIIKSPEKLKELGVKTYIGHSRKSIFEDITKLPPSQRDIETTICSLHMLNKVDYLRVHNVEMHVRAIKTFSMLNA